MTLYVCSVCETEYDEEKKDVQWNDLPSDWVATQDINLRAGLDIDKAERGIHNFLKVSTAELQDFARLSGNNKVSGLSIRDLCTTNSEISTHTQIRHV